MKLEVGKWYVSADGRTIKIQDCWETNSKYDYQSLGFGSFKEDGQYFEDHKSDYDLIMEIDEADYLKFLKEQMEKRCQA